MRRKKRPKWSFLFYLNQTRKGRKLSRLFNRSLTEAGGEGAVPGYGSHASSVADRADGGGHVHSQGGLPRTRLSEVFGNAQRRCRVSYAGDLVRSRLLCGGAGDRGGRTTVRVSSQDYADVTIAQQSDSHISCISQFCQRPSNAVV